MLWSIGQKQLHWKNSRQTCTYIDPEKESESEINEKVYFPDGLKDGGTKLAYTNNIFPRIGTDA